MSRFDRCNNVGVRACLLFAGMVFVPFATAQVAPPLGQAGTFAVLAGSTVTNTGPSTVLGDLGVSPGTAVVGFPPGLISGGTIHSNDAVAQGAQADATTAYNTLAGEASTATLTGQDLGGLTLVSGVYTFSSSAQLTGTLTLDAQGDPAAVFVFQIGSTLTTASGARVVVINGGTDCNVFWQVGSSATLGTTTEFAGNILALTTITLNTGVRLSGRALARTGAVTLDSTNVAICGTCSPLTLAPSTLPPLTVGLPYSQAITVTGGTAPYSFSVINGALPPGMSLTPAGTLAGTPTSSGTFSFTIRATDAAGCIGELTYTQIVNPPACGAITVGPALIIAPIQGTPYLQTMSASGGTAPYAFVGSGNLPPGLSVSTTGALSGTPTTTGSFNFTVTATDSAGCMGNHAYVLNVQPAVCGVISVAPSQLDPLLVGQPFSEVMTASGGLAPYAFTVSAGALPSGLAISAAGPSTATISGTPLQPANYSFTLLVTDASGCSISATYAGTITGTVVAASAPAASLWSVMLLMAALFGAAFWTLQGTGRLRP